MMISGPDDNVFVYFTDHGAAGKFFYSEINAHNRSFSLGLVAFPNGVVCLSPCDLLCSVHFRYSSTKKI